MKSFILIVSSLMFCQSSYAETHDVVLAGVGQEDAGSIFLKSDHAFI